ncbi:hypothetical protein BDZ45DRAFT_52589 [Acephala macrosclerotiorum]|nr:hypothetical protein BDZ45DRAFT_52589 [Acephala macrosclerotiorum]
MKAKRREYTLQEHSTKQEISRSRHWKSAFLPDQRIDMSLIFDSKEQSSMGTSCPSCKVFSEDSQDSEIQCKNCGIWFRRVIEVFNEDEPPISQPMPSLRNYQIALQFGKSSFNDISYGPKPPSQFQSLIIFTKAKTRLHTAQRRRPVPRSNGSDWYLRRGKKFRPFLWYPVGEATFDAAQQQKRDEQAAWDKFRAQRVSLGNTHPDTLTYLHSFTRSLRNWGKYQTAEMIIRDALKSGESELLAHTPEVLQLLLSGLMTVLIDQQKLLEAGDLWHTSSVETFRTKLGEDSAIVLEKRFQQAHPFRPLPPSAPEGAVLVGTSHESEKTLLWIRTYQRLLLGNNLTNIGIRLC